MPRALLALIALLVLVMPSSGGFDLRETVPTWESHHVTRDSDILFFDDMESGENGWTHRDEGAVTYFHVDTYMAYSSGHSWWCGTFDYDSDGGYGNGWDQRLVLPTTDVTGATYPVLTFVHYYDSEVGYDYTYVQAKQGGAYVSLNSGYDGRIPGGTWVDLGLYGFDLRAMDSPVEARFRFISDGGWSDQDGLYQSVGGAYMVDDIKIFDYYTAATYFFDDAESGGLCTAGTPPAAGDYWHIIDRACPAYSDPHSWWCGDDADTNLVPPNLVNTLTSPLVDIIGMDEGYVFFRAHFGIPGGGSDYLRVELSTDGGSAWYSFGRWYGDVESCDGWSSYAAAGIDLAPHLPGSAFQMRFTMLTSDDGCGPAVGGGAGVMLDDFMVVKTYGDPGTWYVPGDFATIQEAIDRAVSGDVIEVGDGVYTEPIFITKPYITLVASSTPIIDLGKTSTSDPSVGSCVSIRHTAEGTIIDGFTLRHGDNGIELTEPSNCTIRNCEIYENYGNASGDWDHGIGIYCPDFLLGWLEVSNNDIHDNSEMGLMLRGYGHVISDNQIHDNGGGVGSYRSIGVTVAYADSATFTGNDVYGHAGSAFYVLETEFYDGHTYTNNFVHDNDYSIKFKATPVQPSAVCGNAFYNNPSGMINDTAGPLVMDARYNWWGDASGPDAATRGSGDPVGTGILYDPWIGKSGGGNITCDPDPLVLSGGTPTGVISVDYAGGGTAPIKGYSLKFSWNGAVAAAAPVNVTEGDFTTGVSSFFSARTSGTNEITVDCAILEGSGVSAGGTLFTVEFEGQVVDYSTCTLTLFDLDFRDVNNDLVAGIYDDDGEIVVDRVGPSISNVVFTNYTLEHTDAYVKDTDAIGVNATVWDAHPGFDMIQIRADATGLGSGGSQPPGSYEWATHMAGWFFPSVTCSPSNGTVTVTVSCTDPLGNVGTPDSGTIIADNTAPGAITGFDASPAHEEVVLVWDDPSGLDTYLYGVVVPYDGWGDYPFYATAAPAYPPTHTAGDGEAFDALGAPAGTTHAISERDIYYYMAFAYDWALNYGPPDATAQGRSTNYWLGDVVNIASSWVPDGLVTVADFDQLGGTYAVVDPTGTDAECNVGPTDDHSRVGIPLPHDGGVAVVDFEDLMIFSMNYGVVSPRVVPLLGDPCVGALALSIEEVGRTELGVELALVLSGNAGDLKGTSVTLTCEGLEFSGARLSDEMSSSVADVFFWHGAEEGMVTVDLAILGTEVTIGGSGELARLTFTPVSEDYTVGFSEVKLRGIENDDLTAELEGLESGDELPMVFKLVQNSPNPFNPVTRVAYHVPSESRVTIRVFDVTGRLVATLVDRVVEPGRHAAVWNGTNDAGESVGSGVYFCTMETPDFRGSHKMMLLK